MVKSRSQNLHHLVDMAIGRCECPVGADGSPCAHQYFLWAEKLASCVNFAPVFSKEERQKYAKIALGTSLPLNYYECLHGDEHASSENNIEETSSGNGSQVIFCGSLLFLQYFVLRYSAFAN